MAERWESEVDDTDEARPEHIAVWPRWTGSWKRGSNRRARAAFLTTLHGVDYGLWQKWDGEPEEPLFLPEITLDRIDRQAEPVELGWGWSILCTFPLPDFHPGEEALYALHVIRQRLPDILTALQEIVEPADDDCDLVGELPDLWTGPNDEYYRLVPSWPKWTIIKTGFGSSRTKRNYVTRFNGIEYGLSQNGMLDSERVPRYLPIFSISQLLRSLTTNFGWHWHVILTASLPVSEFRDDAPADPAIRSIRQRLPELLARKYALVEQFGLAPRDE